MMRLLLYPGPTEQTGIIGNAAGIDETVLFPGDQQMITIPFGIGDDELGLEVLERYIAMLEIVGNPQSVVLGDSEAEVQVMDDDSE